MNYIGIDPGLSGAIAAIDHRKQEVYDIPTINVETATGRKRRIVNSHKLYHLLEDLTCGGSIVTVERVHAMPRDGVKQAFSFGRSFGIVEGVLAGCRAGYNSILPRFWKEHFGLSKKDKEASIELARKIFPKMGEKLKRKCDHNRAEALLLAQYSKDHYGPKKEK